MRLGRPRIDSVAPRTRPLAGLLPLLALVACGEAAFPVHVTFPEPVEVEKGSVVLYRGIPVGKVQEIDLHQGDPAQPAAVRVTLAISSSEVTLREGDRFHLSSQREHGGPVVAIQPSEEPSPPLLPGATVAGVPPFLSRMEESVSDAVEAISAAVSQSAQRVLAELAESLEDETGDPPAPDPAPPREPPAPSPEPPSR